MVSAVMAQMTQSDDAAQAVDQPVVLFCVGAMKAGTTTLYDLLSQHEACRFSPVKELGFFSRPANDPRGLDYFTRRIKRLRAEVGGDTATPWKRQALRAFRAARRLIRQGDEDAYRDFLMGGVTGRQIVADFDPACAGQPRAVFARMAAFHTDVRFLFVMRDPVARVWSHARHVARLAWIKAGQAPDDLDPRDVVKTVWAAMDTPDHTFWRYTDYARTAGDLQAVAAPGAVGLFVFEELFSDASTLPDLYRFLQIPPMPRDDMRASNKGVAAKLPNDLADALRTRLDPQYTYVNHALGRMPQGWAA